MRHWAEGRLGRLGGRLGHVGLVIALALGWLTLVLISLSPPKILAQGGDVKVEPVNSLAGGDPLPRVVCTPGYTAVVYATGLDVPDGLAFSAAGDLYVTEEGAGRVSRLAPGGGPVEVVAALNTPEGVALDLAGNVYVVEDVANGRLIKRTPTGLTTTITAGLESPEGIVWVDDGSVKGRLYLTESNIQAALAVSSTTPADYRTRLTQMDLNTNQVTFLFTKTALLTPIVEFEPLPVLKRVEGQFWSYTGDLTLGPNGLLYYTNELSNQIFSDTVELDLPLVGNRPVEFRFSSDGSLFTLDPANPAAETKFVEGLFAPEGLAFSPGGNFPLYVAEEDINGSGEGRLSRVDAQGDVTPLCTGFGTLEDVVVAANGWLYLSEDSTGLIIEIQRPGRANQQLSLPLIQKTDLTGFRNLSGLN